MDAAFAKILLYLLVIPLFSSAQPNDCPISYCGQNLNNIRFPFRLIGQQPRTCGFLGFDLRCARPSTMLLNISTSGEFAVRSISYRSKALRIYDPSNCLPARLLTFDLSNSPFSSSNYLQNYTLLRCPNDASLSGYITVDCLSNSSFTTLAIASMSDVRSISANQTGCQITGFVKLPVTEGSDKTGFTSRIDDDIILTWSTPDCETCEAAGVSCGYVNSSTSETRCFYNDGVPRPSHIFKIIAFAMAIPAMAASLMIACLMCVKDRRGELISTRRITAFNTTTVVPDDGVAPPSVVGLDQATIESYTKVVLGESKRLPGHDDAVCTICLSEYHVKDTVRCIPECLHCFHAECIDEWLKMNGTCPVCRNSPSPVHVES
ncbi:hypothetical protein L2E82_14361 [Cichorium intybus]|uniref:Uncharacterized protein n=1 Tax=Cichorium intybus TaxID=13427 RepID=A0ACB9EZH1_CICIN|nr:hypothetical protein L2E82_14361 [Cichorium intybus]